jgi:FAD/FMN-containing dehydrogenase
LYDGTETAAIAADLGLTGVRNLLILIFDGPARIASVQHDIAAAALAEIGAAELGGDPVERWFEQRIGTDWIVAGNETDGAMADTIDLFAPWSVLNAVTESVATALREHVSGLWLRSEWIRPHGASLTFTIFVEADSDEAAIERYQLAWIAAMRAVRDAGGSIASYGGIGQARLPWLPEELGGGLPLLETIKHALDPGLTMNPGRLVP